MSEYDHEPIPGLPGRLPEGEELLWQGSPDWVGLAQRAFHIRGMALYFAALMVWAVYNGTLVGIALTVAGTVLGLALIAGIAWFSARSTIYSITNRRVVLRYGVALQKCINLPFAQIGAAGIAKDTAGRGDIPLQLTGAHRLGYLQFWPHVRPWKLAKPEPMLRSLKDADAVVELLGGLLKKQHEMPEPTVSRRAPLEALAA